VHALLSSQTVPFALNVTPQTRPIQVLSRHGLSGTGQSWGVAHTRQPGIGVPKHTPVWQVSFSVQGLSSSHRVPF
jgi:hypothetical protein